MYCDYEKIVNTFKKPWKILKKLKNFLTNLYKLSVKFWRNEIGNGNLSESQKKFSWNIKIFRNVPERICQKIGKKFGEN